MNHPSQATIKAVSALQQKKARDEQGLLLVEGKHPIEEAVKAGLTLRDWFVLPEHPGSALAVEVHKTPYTVTETMMRKMASTDSPPPCLAVFEKPKPVRDIVGTLVLVLEGIQDPGNLGTLIRSAVAFGVETIVLTQDGVEPYSPKVIRASAGLSFAIPMVVVSRDKLDALFSQAVRWSVFTTTAAAGAMSYRDANLIGACVLVLGNEGRGVSGDILSGFAPQSLTIPMQARVESLNVAISGSILLAEAAAQREKGAVT